MVGSTVIAIFKSLCLVLLVGQVSCVISENFANQRFQVMNKCKKDINSRCQNRTHKMNCLVDYKDDLSSECLQFMKQTDIFSCLDEIFEYCYQNMSHGRRTVLWCLYQTLIVNVSTSINVSYHESCINFLNQYQFVKNEETVAFEVDVDGSQSSSFKSTKVHTYSRQSYSNYFLDTSNFQASIVDLFRDYIFITNSSYTVSYALRITMLCLISVAVGYGFAACAFSTFAKIKQVLTSNTYHLPQELAQENESLVSN